MERIYKLKPIYFLIGFILAMILAFFALQVFDKIIRNSFIFLTVSIVFMAFIGYYFFWLYIIGYGFHKINEKLGTKSTLRKLKSILTISFFIIISTLTTHLYFLFKLEQESPIILNIVYAIAVLYCTGYITIKFSQDFKFYDKKEEPKIFDYIITYFLLGAFPFGILIMHAHIRLILKEHGILRK
ncbi:hypothetical protein [Saccharicrinis sp. FJH54]|uniref:hypothetical protein n=1 Tax=Saccharicrinis sp. FJH54 TaxID=3344665 RepID=UPI0035D50252